MADQTVVHIGENSPEQVAYRLMVHIAACEGKEIHGAGPQNADRKYILDTYAECVSAVRGLRKWKG